jgi:hypothetical protein
VHETEGRWEVLVDELGPYPPRLETFIEQARALEDEDRSALAEARGAIDETFHIGAWRAANEAVAGRAGLYMEARQRIGSACIPRRLEELVRMGFRAEPSEVTEWQGIARLARAGLDDALLALLAADTIPPTALRELYGPWRTMLTAAHQRRTAERS